MQSSPSSLTKKQFLSNELPLASPRSRILAAAVDALFLLGLHCLAFTFFDLQLSNIANAVSITLGWLYLLVCWAAWGATPGQRLLGIRVVTMQGEKISWHQSLLRCLGYALSSVPLKGGFIPIFWDAKRQGWHDRLAKTIVITVSTPSHFPQFTSNRELLQVANCAEPDLAYPGKKWGWVMLGYLLFALVWSYPLALHFTTHRAGIAGDGDVFLWNYWYFKYAIDNGLPLISTDLLFYPNSVSLTYHTMHWFGCILAYPLQNVMNLTATYNTIFIFSLVANAFSLYWMVAAITRNRSASFVVALAIGFSSFFIVHGLGHMNLIAAHFIPWCLLFFYASLTTKTNRSLLFAGMSGLFFVLATYCDWYHAIYCLTGGISLLIVFSWRAPASMLKRHLRSVLALGLIAGVLLSPLLIPTISEKIASGSRSENYMNPTPLALDLLKGQPQDYLKLNPLSPLIRGDLDKKAFYIERSLSPGYFLLFLAIPGVYIGFKKQFPWLWVMGIAFIFSCGYTLAIAETRNFPQLLLLLLGGAPGFGTGMPWNNHSILTMAQHISKDPQSIFMVPAVIDMPFGWIQELLAPLRALRVAARFGLLFTIGLAIFAALGLSYLQERWKNRISPRLLAAIGIVVLFCEYCSIPYPIYSTEIPQFYYSVAKSDEKFAIVDVPSRTEEAGFQYFQTLHHKPIFAAIVSRENKTARTHINNNAILKIASDIVYSERKRKVLSDMLAQRKDLNAEIQNLKELNAKYIVVHKRILQKDAEHNFIGLMEKQKLRKVWDDDKLSAYLVY